MEDTPAPRVRKPTLPPAGGTGARLEARVSVLERTEQHQAQTIDKIERVTDKLDAKVDTIVTDVTTLTGLVNQLLERRKFWTKITAGVLVALVVTLFGFLIKISFIVQSAKLPGP